MMSLATMLLSKQCILMAVDPKMRSLLRLMDGSDDMMRVPSSSVATGWLSCLGRSFDGWSCGNVYVCTGDSRVEGRD
jgi:hypothetical protein